jgi:hypothetical protein
MDHIFGYASLVGDWAGEGTLARLRGYRRSFGVATDNTVAIPGYKMYLRRSDGVRPAVFVAFVDIHPDPHTTVNGLARPVDAAALELLDRRERNYDRIDVTDEIDGVDGRVWTYRGKEEGRERVRRGMAEGRVVVSRDYIERVRAGFEALGEAEQRAFAESSDLDDLPVWDLERLDLPEDAPAPRQVPV